MTGIGYEIVQTRLPFQIRWWQGTAVACLTLVIACVLAHLSAPLSLAHDRSQTRDAAPAYAQATGAEYYVSQGGNDHNPGTLTQPFRTIAKGISVLQAGDTLNLRGGIHLATVDIANKHGTATNPIVIRSYPGEHAYIDGSVGQFRTLNNTDWEPAALYDPAAHLEEYVSTATFAEDSVNRGAFLDRNPYTRLITYSKLEDLRAANETFDKIVDPNDPRPGPTVSDEQGTPLGYRRPWVYMGPGLWFNGATRKIHIRLSHTHNQIDGLADYTGEVDPRKVRLAISPKAMTTLEVRGSSYVRFEHLSIRYGGEYTVLPQNSMGLVFDHVRIWGSSYGLRMGGNTNTSFSHCQFNGGMPTWYFRSDRKAEYYYQDGSAIELNILGKQTLRALLLGGSTDVGTEIHHCEFINAHDLYLAGTDLTFHHNWINNLNDEGVFLDAYLTDNVKIYQNVITKTLSAISFAGEQIGGSRYIYRNLIDLRSPTAGFRPRYTGDKAVWRYGHLLKSNAPDGPYDLFQNTFLVRAQAEQASFLHYRDTSGTHRHRSFNNLFVAVNPDAASDVAITFIPSPSFPGPTDGNNYYRIGAATRPPYRYLAYTYDGVTYPAKAFANLDALRASTLFQHSKSQYPPGFEAHSIEANPQFRRIGADGAFRATDDLRLGDSSPAIGAGITLPDDLHALDPLAPSTGQPDIGAYPYDGSPLQVGVDGKRSYPGS